MRRRWLVGLGALALLLAGCDAGSSSQDTGGAGSGPDAPTGIDNAPYVCPDRTHQVEPTGADILPTGATAARLCGVSGTSPAWRAPSGDLRTGLDHLVRLVNSRRIVGAQPGTGCAQQGGSSWALVLRYPSGTRTITGDNAGCWDLRVGITERWGAQRVYDAYLAALLRQRRQDGSPAVLHPPTPLPAARRLGLRPAPGPGGGPDRPRRHVGAVRPHRSRRPHRRAPEIRGDRAPPRPRHRRRSPRRRAMAEPLPLTGARRPGAPARQRCVGWPLLGPVPVRRLPAAPGGDVPLPVRAAAARDRAGAASGAPRLRSLATVTVGRSQTPAEVGFRLLMARSCHEFRPEVLVARGELRSPVVGEPHCSIGRA